MTKIMQWSWAFGTVAMIAACARPATDNLAADNAARPAEKSAVADPGRDRTPAPSTVKPSPWQPEAEVDPVPPPVEGDDPAR